MIRQPVGRALGVPMIPLERTLSRFTPARSASVRFAPLRFASLRSTLERSASVRFASVRFAQFRSTLERAASVRFAPLRFASLRSTDLTSQPDRFAPDKSTLGSRASQPTRSTPPVLTVAGAPQCGHVCARRLTVPSQSGHGNVLDGSVIRFPVETTPHSMRSIDWVGQPPNRPAPAVNRVRQQPPAPKRWLTSQPQPPTNRG